MKLSFNKICLFEKQDCIVYLYFERLFWYKTSKFLFLFKVDLNLWSFLIFDVQSIILKVCVTFEIFYTFWMVAPLAATDLIFALSLPQL